MAVSTCGEHRHGRFHSTHRSKSTQLNTTVIAVQTQHFTRQHTNTSRKDKCATRRLQQNNSEDALDLDLPEVYVEVAHLAPVSSRVHKNWGRDERNDRGQLGTFQSIRETSLG